MFQIHAIPAFSDNYIWCIQDDTQNALVIDPGCAKSVIRYFEDHSLNLSAILITHHHPDHIGGVPRLQEHFQPEIYAYQGANFSFAYHPLQEKQQFSVLGIQFSVIEVPGHTLDHIAFYTETPLNSYAKPAVSNSDNAETTLLQPSLFCGDTLFSGGCGRLFEGTPAQMFASFEKINALPDETHIFCAHEYTLSNLKFAKTFMPTNKDLLAYQQNCESRRREGLPTIPSNLKTERAINPFLRGRDPEIIALLRQQGALQDETALSVFTELRKAKDRF